MPISKSTGSELARLVAGEDLRNGDFVTILNEVHEYPSFFWCCDSQVVPSHEPVRVQWRARGGGTRLKVKAICLPFVMVKAPNGKYRSLDVRRCQLVQLTPDYARKAWKALRDREKVERRPVA